MGNEEYIKNYIYDRQLIITFFPATSVYRMPESKLKEKWDAHHTDPCVFVEGNDLFNNRVDPADDEKLKMWTDKPGALRIYIFAHGYPGAQHLLDSERKPINWDLLVPKLKEVIGNQEVVVNMVVCSAAKEHDLDPTAAGSLAAKLHVRLVQATGRDIPVVGRRHLVLALAYDHWDRVLEDLIASKLTVSLDVAYEEAKKNPGPYLTRKQPGSKVMFTIDEQGKQIILDSYYYNWKFKVIQTLTVLERNTKLASKKEFLTNWKQEFETKTADEILAIMKAEIANPKTVLNAHFIPGQKFFIDAGSYLKIQALIREREAILASKHTLTGPVETGNHFISVTEDSDSETKKNKK